MLRTAFWGFLLDIFIGMLNVKNNWTCLAVYMS